MAEMIEQSSDPDPQGETGLALVALNPLDLATAQSALIQWCEKKCHLVRSELRDLSRNLAIAKEHKWRVSGFQRAIHRVKGRLTFYAKVKTALAAGYLVVPNLPVDLFAIRTTRTIPWSPESPSSSPRVHQQSSQVLEGGKGQYVSPHPTLAARDDQETQKDKRVTLYFADEFRDVEFPVTLVKPQVLSAVAHAMALKVFDEIGVVSSRQHDPIAVGRIKHPLSQWGFRGFTFFLAWWLNTENL